MTSADGSNPLVVVGAGGFGRETIDVARAAGFQVLGVVDDAPDARARDLLDRMDVEWLGALDGARAEYAPHPFVVAVGDPSTRRMIVSAFERAGWTPTTIVDPSARIGPTARIGSGSVVCAGVVIGSGVAIGSHVHVNPGAVIGHDTVLSSFVSVNPNATVSGSAEVGAGALIGAGSVVLQGLVIGAGCVVGAAACVTHDIGADDIVIGIPARSIHNGLPQEIPESRIHSNERISP